MAKKAKKKKRPVGRPTKYKDTIPAKVGKYITECRDKQEGEDFELPTRAGLSLYLKVSAATIDTWEKIHPEFLGALSELNQEQRNQLINRGLNNKANPTIAKLLLSHNHGMREKQDLNVEGTLNVIIKN